MGTARNEVVKMGIMRQLGRPGRKAWIDRDDLLRGMARDVGGVSFKDLQAAVDSLKAQGLVEVTLTGRDDFMVKPTPKGLEEARKYGAA
jgi:hypothetical protein